MQQQRAFFYSVLLLSNASELTKGVADVVVARTENSLVSAIEEAKELILRRIEMTIDHLEASYGKLIPVLVKAIQELTQQVKDLKKQFG